MFKFLFQEFIKKHKPAIVVKGKEYESKQNPEFDALKEFGGQLIFSSGEISSMGNPSLKIEDNKLTSAKIAISNFMNKHDIKTSRLLDILGEFRNRKVCVVGDLIIDEYVECFPLGMSQEEPCIVEILPVEEHLCYRQDREKLKVEHFV